MTDETRFQHYNPERVLDEGLDDVIERVQELRGVFRLVADLDPANASAEPEAVAGLADLAGRSLACVQSFLDRVEEVRPQYRYEEPPRSRSTRGTVVPLVKKGARRGRQTA